MVIFFMSRFETDALRQQGDGVGAGKGLTGGHTVNALLAGELDLAAVTAAAIPAGPPPATSTSQLPATGTSRADSFTATLLVDTPEVRPATTADDAATALPKKLLLVNIRPPFIMY